MTDRILVSADHGVVHVKLNRPDKLNALDQGMFQGIVDTAARLATDAGVRAVVLSGEGRAFCAGLDFASFMGMTQGNGAAAFDGFKTTDDNPANIFQRTGYDWQRLPVPVIAALHGHVYGGGLQIALGTDIRYAAPDTKMSVMEIKWGLIPDMSGTRTLRDLVRLDVAKELTFTGRIVDAVEALELGLVTRICDDPLAEALKTAHLIALKSPHAIRYGKKLLNDAWRSGDREGLAQEAELQRKLIGSPNQMEAVMANMQKRDPKFKDVD